MDAHARRRDGTNVIAIRGEIDLATAEALSRRLKTLAEPAPQKIALDLSQVTFIDCAGFRAVATLIRQVRETGGSVHVGALSPAVMRVCELIGWPDAGISQRCEATR
jgi:anti-anti-sigma factor